MKEFFKKNYKFIITLVLILLTFTIRFPYYIDAPGGIDDVSRKIDIDGFKSEGSFNLAYVREYRATIPTLFISLFNRDWKVVEEEEILLDTEDDTSYFNRDRILMEESISNAIKVAYEYAGKPIKIISSELLVTYIAESANTDLEVGDQINLINGNSVSNKKDIEAIISNFKIGDKLNIQVTNKNKIYDRYAYIIEDNGLKKIGLLLSNINKYETDPNVIVNVDKNESGSSGGLITALYVYNSLLKEDITHGYTIVGTGTIDLDGNIGSIGGVEYKLKSAVKANADLFIVPNDENYDEAIKLKKENNYDIDIIGVSTFEEVIEYLKNLK